MSKLIKVSPTQINTYDDEKNPTEGCKRKWAWIQIAGIRTPPSVAMQFGTEVHTALEQWLKRGEPLPDNDVGDIARQGIKKGWLPTPSRDLVVEKFLEIPVHAGLKIIGYADCIVPPKLNFIDGWPVVIDHKSTVDLRYAKAAEDLKFNAQPIIYGKWAMDEYGTKQAEARWIYYAGSKERPKKPKGSKKVSLLYDLDSIQEGWNHILGKAEEIVVHRHAATDPMKIEPNALACNAYGGCPHRKLCTDLTPGHKLKAHFAQFNKIHGKSEEKEGHMNLMDKLNQIKAEQAGNTPVESTNGKGEWWKNKQNGQKDALSAKEQASQTSTDAQNVKIAMEPAESVLPATAPVKSSTYPDQDIQKTASPAKVSGISIDEPTSGKEHPWWKGDGHKGMNPPESAKAVEEAVSSGATEPTTSVSSVGTTPPIQASEKATLPVKAVDESLPGPSRGPSSALIAEPKKTARRTYKVGLEEGFDEGFKEGHKKGFGEGFLQQEGNVVALGEQGETFKAKHDEIYDKGHEAGLETGCEKGHREVHSRLRVFINCIPQGTDRELLRLVDVLKDSMAQVADKEKVAHWNLVPYAQGSALLAQDLDAAWSNGGKPTGDLLIDMRSAEARAIRTVIDAHADEIIEAIAV